MQQADAPHHGDLAQQLQNPVSSPTFAFFQNNFDFRDGPKHDGSAYTMNFKPVVPIRLSDSWSAISRTILLLGYNERISPSHEAADAPRGRRGRPAQNRPETRNWKASPLGRFCTPNSGAQENMVCRCAPPSWKL